jgi:predicted transcriptional regulator
MLHKEQGDLFGDAPYARGSDTSKAAAESLDATTLTRLRRAVFNVIAASNDRGATCDEIEVALNRTHQTVSARVNELAQKFGLIEDSGKRRRTRSRRDAVVYQVKVKPPKENGQ